MEEGRILAKDGLEISYLYSHVEDCKACVQLVHGMIEHKERYIPFMEELKKAGYSVILSDNRGHGTSINEEYRLGHIGTPEVMVEDQYLITKVIKEKNPGKSLYMFSHSMGTLIARNYLIEHDDEIEKLILCGTVACYPIAGFAVGISKLISILFGKYKRSKLLFALSNDMSFKEDIHWLSYNEENLKNYLADPLCCFKFDNYGYIQLFAMVKNLKKYKKYKLQNPNLKILSLSGKDDRTTKKTKGLRKTMNALRKIGYLDVNFKEYEHMKHEILKEKDADIVIKDIIEFYR